MSNAWRAQDGHWKSLNSTTTNGAFGLPLYVSPAIVKPGRSGSGWRAFFIGPVGQFRRFSLDLCLLGGRFFA